jgi:hypothetical protein
VRVRQRIFCAALAVCAPICVSPARALASASQESVLMDDDHLIYSSPNQVARTLGQIASLGVDRVKVSLVWSIVAPSARSKRRPHFDAANPAAYPHGAWDRYDMIVRLAQELGMSVYFEINPPAPAWAVSNTQRRQGYAWSQFPSALEYREFVRAAGRRYSGAYVATVPRNEPPPSLLGIPLPLQKPPPPAGQPDPIPRVDFWGIWNEPNEASWLNPQWEGSGSHTVFVGPRLYRDLVNAAWEGLDSTGHGGDTIVIGETASRGWILPLRFVQDLYCINGSGRPLTGGAAAQVQCPTSGARGSFVANNPGLFNITGYAHHPYSFDHRPNWRPPLGWVTLQNLGSLEHLLTRAFNGYGQRTRGVPLYLTEWGYKTNPPNPFARTSLQDQAQWLNQGEYMTYSAPYVRSLTQFLLFDDHPNTGFRRGSRAYWGPPATGLEFTNGTPKPAYDAYRIPVWVPSTHRSSRLMIWGQLRPANHGELQTGVIEFRRRAGERWKSVRVVQTANPRGFFIAHVSIRSAGMIRVALFDPHGDDVDYSRTVRIR